MVKYIIARQLGGKLVITTNGEELGRLDDVIIDEKTGGFIFIIIEPNRDILERISFPKDEIGNLIVPYNQVKAVSKVVIVED